MKTMATKGVHCHISAIPMAGSASTLLEVAYKTKIPTRLQTDQLSDSAGAALAPAFYAKAAAHVNFADEVAVGAMAGSGTTAPAVGKDVAIAAMPDGSAQLVVVGADDVVYHQIRHPDRWTGFQPLAGNGTTAPAKGKRVAVAGMADGRSQVVIIGWDDRIYHQIRAVDGAWSGFQPLNGAGTTLPAAGKDVAIGTHPDGSAQVLIIGADDGIYHRIRTSDAWTEFQTVAGTDGTPAKGSRVAISGHDDNSAQVVIMGR